MMEEGDDRDSEFICQVCHRPPSLHCDVKEALAGYGGFDGVLYIWHGASSSRPQNQARSLFWQIS